MSMLGFVADTDAGGETEAESIQVVEHLGDETAALGSHPDEAGIPLAGQEGGVQS